MNFIPFKKITRNPRTRKALFGAFFIGIILSGIFIVPVNVSAQQPQKPVCQFSGITANTPTNGPAGTNCQLRACTNADVIAGVSNIQCTPTQSQGGAPNPQAPDNSDALEKNALAGCGVIMKGTLGGCLVAFFYYIFNGLSAMLLTVAARFFDLMLALTLSSAIYGDFIGKAWVVVRDISNIFFILILLYVAIQTILGIGHDTKKVIANVVIMALLINFSMFFSKVVIDASNILALIFYNKMDTSVVDKNGVARDINYLPVLDPTKAPQDKDLAGAIVNRFNPSKLLDQKFFDRYTKTEMDISPGVNNLLSAYVGAKVGTLGVAGAIAIGLTTPPGWVATAAAGAGAVAGYLGASHSSSVPIPLMLGIITITGAMMLFAAYAFFVAGWSFLGRLMELWMLIIASPFAFMSLSVPALAKLPYAGWTDWTKRLLKASFMAPIFMFFMYLIILLIKADPIGSLARNATPDQSWMEYLLLLIIPSLLILGLLLQASKFAKKGAGEIGEMTVGFGKALTGLAVGGAFAGVALGGRSVIGRGFAKASQSEEAVHYGKARLEFDEKLNKWEKADKATRGVRPTWNNQIIDYQTRNPGVTIDRSPLTALGGYINKSQLKAQDVGHGRHEWEKLKEDVGAKGVADKNISGAREDLMVKKFTKDKTSEIREDVRRGHDSKNRPVVISENGVVATGEDDYKNKRRSRAVVEATMAPNPGDLDASGKLTDQGQKRVENTLNKEFTEILMKKVPEIGKDRFEHLREEKDQTINVGERVMGRSPEGTYDARNLANLPIKEGGTFSAKALTGLTLAIAAGLRAGLKKADVNTGTPQGAFLKDLGNTLTDAMKSAKVNIDVSGATEEHKEDSHGGGGGHH